MFLEVFYDVLKDACPWVTVRREILYPRDPYHHGLVVLRLKMTTDRVVNKPCAVECANVPEAAMEFGVLEDDLGCSANEGEVDAINCFGRVSGMYVVVQMQFQE